jgi:GTPase
LAKPVVVLIGRQNVGKSTLLNRIAGKPVAIIEDFPGTTRDRIFADAIWNGVEFSLVDTGGLEFLDSSTIGKGVRQQAEAAIAEADVVIFLTDVRQGLMPIDADIADILRKSKKPVLLAINKVDGAKQETEIAEFHKLGFKEIFPISGHHGRRVADLLDRIIDLLPPPPVEPPAKFEGIAVAIVGHPHVGKSLLLNKLLGQERSIVGDKPGTTRDAIDTPLDFEGQSIILIDTAGIRRRGKVERGIEWYSVIRSMKAVDRADIALLVLDATETLTAQDTHIAGYVEKAGKGVIVVVNKWDLVTEKNKSVFTEFIQSRLKFIPYAPILFVSAKSGQGVNKIMPLVLQVAQERSMRIPDEEVNTLIKDAVSAHNLPHQGKKVLNLYSASQSEINPPVFRFVVNDTKLIHFSYERFLENKLRGVYSFNGTPIRLVFKTKG